MADQEQHRLECEARYWLRRGYSTPDKIAELRELLRKRSAGSIDRLIEEMRPQWPQRLDWL